MNNEEYIFKKLENLSPVDKVLCEKIVKALGEWAPPKDVAKYLGQHINTIYGKINNEEIISRKIGVRRVVFVPSVILIME